MSGGRAKTPATMTAAQAGGLRAGDEVFVICLLVTVETSRGGRVELDAGWLEAPELAGPL